MNIGRIIDLSHQLEAGKEEFMLEMKTYFVDELYPKYKRKPDDWYILNDVTFRSHVGTHVEVPYHYLKDGKDTARMPLERLVGEGVVINFTHKKPGDAITPEDMEKNRHRIKEGDIVLIRTGLDKYYRTEKAHERPYFKIEAIGWLIEKRIHCLGVDCTGIEPKNLDYQPNHELLFKHDIPLVEYLTNLDKIKKERFWVFILPLPIKNLEASPVRVIAVEETDD